jgi:hypothetical protein
MRKHTCSDPVGPAANAQLATDAPSANAELPNRLMTAFEVAEFVGCHEESVRRACLRGLLVSQRFGVRGRRFHPADVTVNAVTIGCGSFKARRSGINLRHRCQQMWPECAPPERLARYGTLRSRSDQRV